jgi:ferredoxin
LAGQPSDNLFVAGEMMAGNVLGKGYTAGVGMSIGTAFGRIAGTQAAQAALRQGTAHAALEALTRDARALASGAPVLSAPEDEVARQMQICNACRYCEGFCAVFPAMTRRLEFGKADIHFLANLCHNCGACLHACQYAPPHEFAVNVPQAMAQVRGQTYADFAWPPALGALYQRNGLTLSLALAAGLALFLLMALAINGTLIGGTWTATSTSCSRTTCWWACLRRCSGLRCWRWPWACASSGARCRRPPAVRRSAGRRRPKR